MKLKLSKEQWKFVNQLGVADREYSDEEIDDYVIEIMYEHLMKRGWKSHEPDYEINDVGSMCESVIDAIEEQR